MKFSWMKWSVLPAAILLVGGVAVAQDQSSSGSQSSQSGEAAAPAPAEKPKPTVAQRKENQQDRIANGVKNGSLTPGEASRLEHQETQIHREARDMRQDNGGTLTQADKQRLNHQQNVESRRINRAKHNGRNR